MQELFFNTNLKGLVDELGRYSTKQEKYLKEGIINQKEFINKIAKFIHDIKLDKYQYNAVLVDKKDRKEVINSVLTNEKVHSKVHQKLHLMSNENN